MRERERRALLLAFVVMLAGGAAWFGVPRWLSVEDPLEACPAVVVLNGDPPARANEAARLYRLGSTSEIWLTSDPLSSDEDGDAGTRWNTTHLVRIGVAAPAIRVVPGHARGTRAELELVAAELTRRKISCALVVTSPLHARRVKVTWRRHIGASPRVIVRLAPDANYVGWDRTLKELAGTVRALAGYAP
jgi:uncharacterized SAM-binding protein YcdF (DUF218 family)